MSFIDNSRVAQYSKYGGNIMSMNQDDIIKYKSLYLQTSWGYLNMLRKNVAFLLRGNHTEDLIDAVHLASHSLKSQSILMGYNQIGKFSGAVEQIFRESKEKTYELNNETLEVLSSGLSKVQQSLVQLADNGGELDMSEETRELENALTG